jgi:hypothetical protein
MLKRPFDQSFTSGQKEGPAEDGFIFGQPCPKFMSSHQSAQDTTNQTTLKEEQVKP